MFDPAMLREIGQGILDTLYITIASTLISYVIGLPMGVIEAITAKGGLCKNSLLHGVLGVIINIVRSVPFLILMIMLIPFTRAVVGTAIGNTATIVPLVIAAAPFVARMVESSLLEVDHGVVEAAQSMGASPWKIITGVLLPEAKPSLINGGAIALITILGYSAMAGIVGGGGLGKIAMDYGLYRYQNDVMVITVIILVILVQIFQEIGMLIMKKSDRRAHAA